MLKRTLSGLVYGSLFLLSVYYGGVVFIVFIFLLSLFSVAEFYKLASKYGKVSKGVGYLALIALYFLLYYDELSFLPAVAVFLSFFLFIVEILKGGKGSSVVFNIGATLMGFFYCGVGLAYLVVIRNSFSEGLLWVVFLLFITWACDVFAYIIGKIAGSTPLSPNISPAKTVEGAVGGILGSISVALGFAYWFLKPVLPVVIMALCLSIVGQLGDLAESLIKRQANVKDSGKIIPGHGGVLDRVDSLLFNAPIFYYLLLFFS